MNDILSRLKPLILELKELPKWPEVKIPAGLLLYDVLTALGATRTELEGVFDQEVFTLVESPVPVVVDAERIPTY
jgi:hypothetical protein